MIRLNTFLMRKIGTFGMLCLRKRVIKGGHVWHREGEQRIVFSSLEI